MPPYPAWLPLRRGSGAGDESPHQPESARSRRGRGSPHGTASPPPALQPTYFSSGGGGGGGGGGGPAVVRPPPPAPVSSLVRVSPARAPARGRRLLDPLPSPSVTLSGIPPGAVIQQRHGTGDRQSCRSLGHRRPRQPGGAPLHRRRRLTAAACRRERHPQISRGAAVCSTHAAPVR